MGDLQTYFYLALVSGTIVTLTLLFVGIVIGGLRRWRRQQPEGPQAALTFWLIAGAATVAFLFITLGTAGVLYGFLRYGAS